MSNVASSLWNQTLFWCNALLERTWFNQSIYVLMPRWCLVPKFLNIIPGNSWPLKIKLYSNTMLATLLLIYCLECISNSAASDRGENANSYLVEWLTYLQTYSQTHTTTTVCLRGSAHRGIINCHPFQLKFLPFYWWKIYFIQREERTLKSCEFVYIHVTVFVCVCDSAHVQCKWQYHWESISLMVSLAQG